MEEIPITPNAFAVKGETMFHVVDPSTGHVIDAFTNASLKWALSSLRSTERYRNLPKGTLRLRLVVDSKPH